MIKADFLRSLRTNVSGDGEAVSCFGVLAISLSIAGKAGTGFGEIIVPWLWLGA